MSGLLRQLAQLRQQQQQQTNQAAVLSQLTAALNASPNQGAVSAATVNTAPLQMLPQGTVILQPPATSVAAAAVTRAGVVPQPQVVLINSAALQPQLIVPTGQVSCLCSSCFSTFVVFVLGCSSRSVGLFVVVPSVVMVDLQYS